MNFIFLVYLVGLILAVFQDFKRREIDDWLNLFLFFSGSLFIFLFQDFQIGNFGFYLFICFSVCVLLNYCKIFGGGDTKLLFALIPFFYNTSFGLAISNFLIFILLLFIAGSIYGLIYSFFILARNYSKVKPSFEKSFRKTRWKIFASVIVLIFLLGLYNFLFFYVALAVMVLYLLFCLALSIDSSVMLFQISTKNICSDDIIMRDLKVGNRIFRANNKRLSDEEADFLSKHNLKVWIKDGVPYGLAFLIAFILYYFRELILDFIL